MRGFESLEGNLSYLAVRFEVAVEVSNCSVPSVCKLVFVAKGMVHILSLLHN